MTEWQNMLKDKGSVQQLILLVEATRLCRETDTQSVRTGPIYEFAQEQWGIDHRFVDQQLESMKSHQFLYFEKSLGGIGDFHMTPQGFEAAYSFDEYRQDKAKRFVAVRDQLIQWMYDQILDGIEHPDAEGFLTSKFNDFYGSAFTESEMSRGLNRLHSDRFIEGFKAVSGTISAMTLTPSGIYKAENHESVTVRSGGATLNHYDQRNYGGNVAVHGSPGAQVVSNSQNVTQTSTMTAEQLETAQTTADAFRRLVPLLELPADKEEEVTELLDVLDAELKSPEPKVGRGTELISKIGEVAATSTVSSVVTTFTLLAQQFMGLV